MCLLCTTPKLPGVSKIILLCKAIIGSGLGQTEAGRVAQRRARGLIAGQWLEVWASALLGAEWDRPLSSTGPTRNSQMGFGRLLEAPSLETEASGL